jgi:RHS repeat-associated protein
MRQIIAALIILLIITSSFSTAYAISGHDLFYDANGNLIKGDGYYYEYNDANQLTKVRNDNSSGTIIAEYAYDNTGKRIKKISYTESGNKTTYYIGNHFETEIIQNSSGTFTKNTTYYHVNNEKVAKDVNDGATVTTSYYHTDHLGSSSVITDESGDLVERTKYYPYGSMREGGEANKYYYTGKELDMDTGLYYYGARYYHPTFATFTQADTIIPDVYDPQSLNRYTYVLNNPLKYIDPTGHLGVYANINLYPNNKGEVTHFEHDPELIALTEIAPREEYLDGVRRDADFRFAIDTVELIIKSKLEGGRTDNKANPAELAGSLRSEDEYFNAGFWVTKTLKNDDELNTYLLENEGPNSYTPSPYETHVESKKSLIDYHGTKTNGKMSTGGTSNDKISDVSCSEKDTGSKSVEKVIEWS